MEPRDSLADRMRARADADGLPASHDVRTTADKMERAAEVAGREGGVDNVRAMLSAWVRARKAWNAYTGEPII